ncbi:fasciclin-1-like [Tachypleus tridentatus]|uniref:fasciclin-1-like n=1 Tax=Tachypleus tridentatus TaxID=6853 RepID=UPI003FD25EF2
MKSLFLVTLCCCWTSLVCAKSIYEAIENNPKLSKFYDLTKNDELVQVLLKKRRVTVFVPSNEAFSRARQFAPEDEERLASYHIVSMVVTRDLFPDSIYAVSQENPPLYFSVKEQPGNGEKEYFVNNAKLLEDRDYNVDDGKQKLYIIDEVLEPYRSTENLPPDAWELLSNPSLYNIREELSAMASRVRKEEQVDTFTKVGNHTYFIPIGEENGPTGSRIRDVDSNVIKGHVISIMFSSLEQQGTKVTFPTTLVLKLSLSIRVIHLTVKQFS